MVASGSRTMIEVSLDKDAPEASNHTPSSADFTTTTPELKFSVHTGDREPKLARRDHTCLQRQKKPNQVGENARRKPAISDRKQFRRFTAPSRTARETACSTGRTEPNRCAPWCGPGKLTQPSLASRPRAAFEL